MDPADFYFFNHKKRKVNKPTSSICKCTYNSIFKKMILLKTSAGYYVYIHIYIF